MDSCSIGASSGARPTGLEDMPSLRAEAGKTHRLPRSIDLVMASVQLICPRTLSASYGRAMETAQRILRTLCPVLMIRPQKGFTLPVKKSFLTLADGLYAFVSSRTAAKVQSRPGRV